MIGKVSVYIAIYVLICSLAGADTSNHMVGDDRPQLRYVNASVTQSAKPAIGHSSNSLNFHEFKTTQPFSANHDSHQVSKSVLSPDGQWCWGNWQSGPHVYLSPFLIGNEIYAAFQDPDKNLPYSFGECDYEINYPFRIHALQWHVYCHNPDPEHKVSMQFVVFDADLTNPDCPVPGNMIYEGPILSGYFQLGAGLYYIDEAPRDCIVNGPYFAGVRLPDNSGQGIFEPIFSDGSEGVPSCRTYNSVFEGPWLDLIADLGIPGNLYSFSGGEFTCATVAETWSGDGEASGDLYGFRVCANHDITGDGIPDYVVGAPDNDRHYLSAGMIYIYDGSDGSLIRDYSGAHDFAELGHSIEMIDDLDGDGKAEIIVGSPGQYDSGADAYTGSAIVLRTRDWTHLYSFSGGDEGDRRGHSVAACGDIDGRGKPDIMIGAPEDDGANNLLNNVGAVHVHAGEDGAWIMTIYGEQAYDQFGYTLAGLDDINGDDCPDILVGTPWNDEGGSEAGKVYVVSGADGSFIRSHTGPAGSRFGWSIAAVGDPGLDGVDDYIVGAPWESAGGSRNGKVYLFSGADGSVDDSWFIGSADNAFYGTAVADAGDINGDGYSEIIIGASGMSRPDSDVQGMVVVYSITFPPQVLLRFDAESDATGYTGFGEAVAGAGDLGSDGVPEVIAGAWMATPPGGNQEGRAFVYHIDYQCETDPEYVCGDANGDGSVNVSDAVYIINYVFKGGPPPDPLESGDVDCNGAVNVADAVYIINYIFKGGPPPCDPDGDGTPNC